MHQIQRHLLTIDCSSSSFGKEVQLVVADLMEKEFYPKLELLLDQYPAIDATWVIDSIQITLPSVSKKNWKNELVSHALHQIEAFLNENFKDINTIDNSEHAASSTTLIQNPQLAAFLFIDYLKTGQFNRSSLFKTVLDIEKKLAETTFKDNEKMHAFCNELVSVLLEHSKSLIRFIYTISKQTKAAIRSEKIGFLFDIAAVLKDEKPDKKFFASSQDYSNWISLLEWSLYFYKMHNAKNVIHRFAASSLVDFQLKATEINRFLVFLIHSSKGKITKEEQDIVFAFTKKMKELNSAEANFKTAAGNQINESGDEGDFETAVDTISKPETNEETILLKKIEAEMKPHKEEIEMGKYKSETDQNVSDATNTPSNLIDAQDKEHEKNANEATVTNLKQDNLELLKNVDTNSNSLNEIEDELHNRNSIDDATPFTTENSNKSGAIAAHSEINSDLKETSKISKENARQNDNEDAKIAYRRFNFEEDTTTTSTISDEAFATSKMIIENPIYIENAGLVILHPLLVHLFEQLNLCKSDEWTSKRNQHKAVLITQYLITGSTVFFENDLMLNKILCGLEADAVIDVSIKLSAKECKEANGLLEAVIGYWKALNNSSIDSLRETFLQRNGKLLFKNETDIELWVEQKGFDVLMAQIPWGIGMIKTPWMNRFIYCHWN